MAMLGSSLGWNDSMYPSSQTLAGAAVARCVTRKPLLSRACVRKRLASPGFLSRGTNSEPAAPALRLWLTFEDDPLEDADAHLVVGPLAPSDNLGRLVLVGGIRVGVIEMRLHLKPRTLWYEHRLLECVCPLPVEVPAVDLDQRNAGLAVGQDSREGKILDVMHDRAIAWTKIDGPNPTIFREIGLGYEHAEIVAARGCQVVSLGIVRTTSGSPSRPVRRERPRLWRVFGVA